MAEAGLPQEKAGKSLVVGITGASGVVFARRLLQMLEADARVEKIHLVVSSSGLKVLRDELDLDVARTAEVPARLLGGPIRRKIFSPDEWKRDRSPNQPPARQQYLPRIVFLGGGNRLRCQDIDNRRLKTGGGISFVDFFIFLNQS